MKHFQCLRVCANVTFLHQPLYAIRLWRYTSKNVCGCKIMSANIFVIHFKK